jgi:hypothetical protein
VAAIGGSGFVLAARTFDTWILSRARNPYLAFQLDPEVKLGVDVSFGTLESAKPLPQDLSVLRGFVGQS